MCIFIEVYEKWLRIMINDEVCESGFSNRFHNLLLSRSIKLHIDIDNHDTDNIFAKGQ